MKIIWTTHEYDGACCVQSVRSILALGVDPLDMAVGVTRGKPLTKEIASTLDEMGVSWIDSRYTRRDTYGDKINMLQMLTDHDHEWVLNMDSDTVVNDWGPIEEVRQSDAVGAAFSWPACNFAGCCSMYRVSAAKRILKDLREDNTLKLGKGPEDVAFGRLFDHFYGVDSVARWDHSGLGWYFFKDDSWEELRSKVAIHFGQKAAAREAAKGRFTARDMIADEMRRYLDWRDGK